MRDRRRPSAQGDVECVGYESASATLDACCTQSASGPQTEEVGAVDDNPCGLNLSRYFRDARACEPRQQLNEPQLAPLETCSDQPVGGDVYNGATLRGCCRAADGMCGYYDDITGLGCLSASTFGITPRPCPTVIP